MSRPHPFGSAPQGPQPADPPPSRADADGRAKDAADTDRGRGDADGSAPGTADGNDQPAGPPEESTAPLPLSVDHLADQRYELLETLGSGGMGIVRRARDHRLNRDVAIKLLADNLAADPVSRERFLREARAAAAIADACVVAVYDVGDEAGRPYLVMELVDGPSLADVLRADGPLPVSRMLDVASDALTGLAATHAAGIIHRDVKPGNLLRAPSGRVKLTDLGVAEATDAADASGLTRTGMVVGTRTYLAPERRTGGAATVSTDLYAVGVTLVELLFGPGPRDPRDRVEEARWLPAGLRTMLLQLLATDPAHRPRSAEAALRILEAGDSSWRDTADRAASGSAAPTAAAALPPDGTAVLDDPDPVAAAPAGAAANAASDAETQAHTPDGNPSEGSATTDVGSRVPGATPDGAPSGDPPPEQRSLDRRWRPILIGAAVVALFLVGLFWGSPEDGAATDDAPNEVAPAESGDAEDDEQDAVPRGEDPATTARNLAEWLRER